MSCTIKVITCYIRGPGRVGDLCSCSYSELDWTRLWAAWSNITAWCSFEAIWAEAGPEDLQGPLSPSL